MIWHDGNVSVNHPRERWRMGEPTRILIHTATHIVKGDDSRSSQQSTLQAAYRAAKTGFDAGAALEIVERCVNQPVLDELADLNIPGCNLHNGYSINKINVLVVYAIARYTFGYTDVARCRVKNSSNRPLLSDMVGLLPIARNLLRDPPRFKKR